MREINSLVEFRSIILKNEEFIVITDQTPFNHIHNTHCRLITETNFKKKIITNKKKYGSYFCFNDFSEARKKIPKLMKCRLCNPK